MIKCKSANKYKGLKPPTCGCSTCITKYITTTFERITDKYKKEIITLGQTIDSLKNTIAKATKLLNATTNI